MWKIMKNAKFVKNCVSGKCGVLIGDKVQEMGEGGGSGGVDMYICCDKNNPKVLSGSHSNVVEKMRAGLPPVIIKMLYEMNDADDGGIDAYGVYLADTVLYREQDGRWHIEVTGETSDDAFWVYEDNTVEYFNWS